MHDVPIISHALVHVAAEMECLSPAFIGARPMIVEDLVMVTNTTISVAWNVVAPLPPSCRGVVFSVSPYTYTVDYELITNQPEFTIVRLNSAHSACC